MKITITYLTNILPAHSGNGSAVYPWFVAQALSERSIELETIVADGEKCFGKPWVFAPGIAVEHWPRIGPLSFSLSVRSWASYVLKSFRKSKPKARAVPNKKNARRSKPAPISHKPSGNSRHLNSLLAGSTGDVVLVNMPYLLDRINRETLRDKHIFVLAHDVISDRTALYRKNGWDFDFVPHTVEQEAALLSRADLVIAISDSDAARFRKIAPGIKVITCFPPIVGTIAPPMNSSLADNRISCLFVGSGAKHNLHSACWLVSKAWPLVEESGVNAALDVVGGVGIRLAEIFKVLPASINVAGRVDDLAAAYAHTDLALAFVMEGSGVKMKLLEALAYGVPVIVTPEALRGLPAVDAATFPIVEDAQDLVNLLRRISDRELDLSSLANRQAEWARTHLRRDQLVDDLVEAIFSCRTSR